MEERELQYATVSQMQISNITPGSTTYNPSGGNSWGSTNDNGVVLNNDADPIDWYGHTMPQMGYIVVKPFKNTTHPLNDGDEGYFQICAQDLNISGWTGVDLGTWMYYFHDNGVLEDSVMDSMPKHNSSAGCPFKHSEYDPGHNRQNYTAMVFSPSKVKPAYNFWRTKLNNWDLLTNNQENVDVAPFDYSLTEGYEPHNDDPATYYRFWERKRVDDWLDGDENTGVEDPFGYLDQRWDDRVDWICAVNTHKRIDQGGGIYTADPLNEVLVFIKIKNSTRLLYTLGSSTLNYTLSPEEMFNWNSIQQDIENGYHVDALAPGVDEINKYFKIDLGGSSTFVCTHGSCL